MDKITYQDFLQADGTQMTYVIIDHGNDQFTSMPKAVYEAQQVEHLTSPLTDPTA